MQGSSDINFQMDVLQTLWVCNLKRSIWSSILMHWTVDNTFQSFKEILRVFKLGGCHCFTVLLHREAARFRVRIKNGRKIYLESKHCHGNGMGRQCLVITDFGYDIINLLDDIGYSVEIIWCQAERITKYVCGIVVSKSSWHVLNQRFSIN